METISTQKKIQHFFKNQTNKFVEFKNTLINSFIICFYSTSTIKRKLQQFINFIICACLNAILNQNDDGKLHFERKKEGKKEKETK